MASTLDQLREILPKLNGLCLIVNKHDYPLTQQCQHSLFYRYNIILNEHQLPFSNESGKDNDSAQAARLFSSKPQYLFVPICNSSQKYTIRSCREMLSTASLRCHTFSGIFMEIYNQNQ